MSEEPAFLPVAIVTGAGRQRGIGRAIAQRLGRDGFAVVIHERSPQPEAFTHEERATGWRGAQSVAELIREAGGVASVAWGDVMQRSTAERLVQVATELGEPAVLINNHGTAGEANAHLAHATPDDVWDSTIAVNLTSLQRVCSVVVPAIAQSRATQRALVHFSSTAGHRALSRYGAYCASKAAVEHLTRQQAIELARWGVRVNCIAPGLTPTDMIDATLQRAADAAGTDVASIRDATLKRIPLRRFATTADIANAVGFLCGPDATYITGQVLTVDGGMTLV